MGSFSSKYPTDNFYKLLKLPLLGYEPKRAIFVFVPLLPRNMAQSLRVRVRVRCLD